MSNSATTIILKGTFQSFLINKYGTFLFIFKGNSLEKVKIVAGVNSELATADISKKWTTLEEQIENKLAGQQANPWFSTELEKHIIDRFKNENEETRNKVIHLLRSNNRKKLSTIFIHLFDTVISDKNITFDFNVEEKTEEEYLQDIKEKDKKYVEKMRIEQEKKIKDAFMLPMESTLAKTEFFLAPVVGVPISELGKGDMVYIKLDKTDPNANYLSTYLKAVQNDVIVPIPAAVHQTIKSGNNKFIVVMNLAKNIYSIIEDEEDIRIKPFDSTPKNEQKIPPQKRIEDAAIEAEKNPSKKREIVPIIIVSALIIALLTLIILFMVYTL